MEKLKILNRNQLKYILIVAMIIDHIAWKFVPTARLLGELMHLVGRLTGPSMAILLAEGYSYTTDKMKYAKRLFIFSLISWPAYTLYEQAFWPLPMFGVITTLFLAFIAIWIWDEAKLPVGVKIVILVCICIISLFADWVFADVLWAFFFYLFKGDKKNQWIAFCIIAAIESSFFLVNGVSQLFQLGVFLVPILFLFYNGESGSKKPFHKWFFYVFYPAHLLIIFFIALQMGCYK